MPSPEHVAAFYPKDYYGTASAKFQPLIEWLVRLVGSRHIRFLCADLQPRARVLDVGCGRGVLLTELADRGFEVHGVEHSEAAMFGADPAKIRIARALADAGYPADYFDEVIIWHVLEHLRDPRATLAEVRRIVRPGGRLIVSVPNFGSFQAWWRVPHGFISTPSSSLPLPRLGVASTTPSDGLRHRVRNAISPCDRTPSVRSKAP